MEISFLRAHRMLRLRHVVFLNRALGQILQSLAKEGVLEQNPRAFFFSALYTPRSVSAVSRTRGRSCHTRAGTETVPANIVSGLSKHLCPSFAGDCCVLVENMMVWGGGSVTLLFYFFD